MMTFSDWCNRNDIFGNFREALVNHILAKYNASILTFDFDALPDDERLVAWREVLQLARDRAGKAMQ